MCGTLDSTVLLAHIFFDDAMDAHADDEYDYQVNTFVKLLVNTIDKGARYVCKLVQIFGVDTKMAKGKHEGGLLAVQIQNYWRTILRWPEKQTF